MNASLTVEAPPEVEAPEVEAPPPTAERPRPQRLLILGDSMAATDFGRALEQVLAKDPGVTTRRRGKSSTGLARPDYFDWMQEGEKQVSLHRPELVIVIVGGNDGQDLISTSGGPRVHWGTGAWPAAYTARLERFIKLLARDGAQVAFLGLPLMDRPKLEQKLVLIRGVQEKALAALPEATYVDTRSCFTSKAGELLRTVTVEGYKAPQPLRQADGIHLTVPGAQHFATCARALLAPLLDGPAPPAS